MGIPYFQIKDTLREMKATVFSSHFALYRDISRRVFEVVKAEFSEVEPYSIDECFFAFESDDPWLVISNLKRRVELAVGIPVSIGVSFSKTQAKYVNQVAKRTNGLAVWNEKMWTEQESKIDLSEIWGVGPGRARRFKEKGIRFVSDLSSLSATIVSSLFGIEGVRLQSELRGQAVSLVKKMPTAQKSVTSTRSFANTTTEYSVLEKAILYHLYQTTVDLKEMNLLTCSLRVMIAPSRHGDYTWQGTSQEAILLSPTRNLFTLKKVALALLKDCYKPDIPYKKAGVLLSNLVTDEGFTLSLFSLDEENKQLEKTNVLSQAILDINKKHGKELIQLGKVSTKRADWLGRKDALSPSYTTNWFELRSVRA